jgi:polyhydroxybutyrate depolymerase
MRLLGVLGAVGLALTVGLAACGGSDANGGAASSGGVGDDSGAGDGTAPDPGAGDGSSPINPDGAPPVPSPGCGGNPNVAKGFVGSQGITVGGVSRSFELFVPNGYDGKKSYPLIFMLHGDGGDGAGLRGYFNLEAEAADGAIFVYPDGINQTWFENDSVDALRGDVAFIDAVAASLGKSHCTDKSRVFTVGFSRGAYFSNMLGCHSKSGLRAVVAHSGGGPFHIDGSGTVYDSTGTYFTCPSPPVAAMQIIGTNDDVTEARKARDYWRRVDNCGSGTTAFDPSPCVAYSGCDAARPEVYCEIPGLGHSIWSSGEKAIWNFLKAM